MPHPDTMPVPVRKKEHLYAPDPANKLICYFCGANQKAHEVLT